ncbi:LysR family transcriptional regulator [uncultured Roseovarius sp.]|uniref:LysR family transcriptional regulator n=1 Tax=uncultured Roseovarius sp. TaxID=293344 RepID=UPI0026104C64|nr:LysR family transcriptional regulator [uncultured Roseovarius sp.]
MNRTRIQYFLHLAQSLNFSETARAFRISQPALSKAIKRLEEDLHGPLLRREGRLTHLTPLGRAMVERLSEVEEATRQAEETAQRLTLGGRQQVNIAVMCTVSPRRMMPFMADLRRAHPNIELALDDTPTDMILEALLSGHCDLAVMAAPFDDTLRLKQVELYRESMVVLSHPEHRFAQRDSVALPELEREPYIDRLACEFRDTFLQVLRNDNVMLDVAMRSKREDWVYDGVAANIGVSIVPRDGVDTSRHGWSELAPDPYWRTVSMAVATGREDNDAVRTVLAAARNHDWAVTEG